MRVRFYLLSVQIFAIRQSDITVFIKMLVLICVCSCS